MVFGVQHVRGMPIRFSLQDVASQGAHNYRMRDIEVLTSRHYAVLSLLQRRRRPSCHYLYISVSTMDSSRLNVVKGLKRTNPIVDLGRSWHLISLSTIPVRIYWPETTVILFSAYSEESQLLGS
jgi:hypothetical protein